MDSFSMQTYIKGMSCVFFRCYPFKIFHSVICFDAVYMIYFPLVLRIRNKCLSHQSVDTLLGFLSVLIKNEIQISISSDLAF